jgi:hypothetical protein
MLEWLWPKRPAKVDIFRSELRRVEEDCVRRLSYVEMQLARMARKKSHWSSAMTVVETDLVPMSPSENVAAWFGALRDWQWYLLIGAAIAAFLIVVVSIAFCGNG